MNTTIHQEATWYYREFFPFHWKCWLEKHSKCPERIAVRIRESIRRKTLRDAVRFGFVQAPAHNTEHLRRDFRPGIGSGRSAHWLNLSFEIYAVAARTAHETLGLTKRDAAEVARQCINDRMSDERYDWYIREVGPRIGKTRVEQELHRLRDDPEAKAPPHYVGWILDFQKGKPAPNPSHGYEGPFYLAQHPELWDEFLARKPIGKRGEKWEQTFPYEKERIADLVARGWMEMFRLGDSIWTPPKPRGFA